MEFIKYQSLENHYREKTINWIERNVPNDTVWAVTEKIDGANFAFYTDGTTVKVASRNQFVDSKFYNCGEIIDAYRQNVLDLFAHVKGIMKVDWIIVRGELYGNGIQNRIDYGDKGFVAFELDFCEDGQDSTIVAHCVTNMFQIFMSRFDIPFLEPIAVGTFKECLAFNNEFDSTILNKDNNACEGTVIKGYDEAIRNQFGGRIIIKNKSDAFTEVKAKKRKCSKPDIKYENVEVILGYINTNRVNGLLSKLGGLEALTQKDFGKVLGMFSQDVMQDLIADEVLPVDYRNMEAWSNFGKFITRESQPILKEEVLAKL